MKERYAAPLKAWGFLLVLLGLSQIMVFFYTRYNVQNTKNEIARIRSINGALAHLKEATEAQTQVLIIGSSLVGNGIDCQDNIQQAYGSASQAPVHVTKIWQSGDPFRELVVNEHLLDTLIQLKPDLICIQNELLTTHFRESGGIYNALSKVSMYNKVAIYYLLNQVSLNFIKTESSSQCLPEGKVIVIDTLNYQPISRTIKRMDEVSFAFDGLKKLQEAGIKTVILDLPRPLKSEEKMLTPELKEQHQRLLDRYQKDFGIVNWKYTGREMYFSDFIDGGHLNEKGRKHYTQWLLEKIKTERLL